MTAEPGSPPLVSWEHKGNHLPALLSELCLAGSDCIPQFPFSDFQMKLLICICTLEFGFKCLKVREKNYFSLCVSLFECVFKDLRDNHCSERGRFLVLCLLSCKKPESSRNWVLISALASIKGGRKKWYFILRFFSLADAGWPKIRWGQSHILTVWLTNHSDLTEDLGWH